MIRVAALVAATTLLAGCAAVSGVPPASDAPVHVFTSGARHCHVRGHGLYVLPDRRCTPGALNPAVTQATIHQTICVSGWTSKIRPPESVTRVEKRRSMAAYGLVGPSSNYEYDHLVPLSLGGAPNASRNLWPQPDYAHPSGFDLNPKDSLEYLLYRHVCSGEMSLAHARRVIVANWVAAYRQYVH